MARAEDTRRKFIDSAEILFGTRGIDQVKTKELLVAAEQKNESALQYHFGSRAALIEEIIKERMKEMDERRLELLSVLEEDGKTTVRSLFEIMIQPIAERVAEGKNGPAFVGLLAQVAGQPGISFPDMIERFDLQGAKRVRELLLSECHTVPATIMRQRDHLTLNMAAIALKAWSESREVPFQVMFDDLVTTIAAVATAPPTASALAWVRENQ